MPIGTMLKGGQLSLAIGTLVRKPLKGRNVGAPDGAQTPTPVAPKDSGGQDYRTDDEYRRDAGYSREVEDYHQGVERGWVSERGNEKPHGEDSKAPPRRNK